MVEEFILEPAEESLHRRVVRAAPLLRHRPGQVVLFADRYPARPTVMATAIGMGHGAPALAKSAACGLEAAVGELRVRARADRPGGQPAVEAVENRGQVHLAVRKPELRDVGEPQLVGRRGSEVAVDQVPGRIGYLALVRAVPRRLLRVRDRQPLLAHDAAHHLLGRHHRVVPGPVFDTVFIARMSKTFFHR